MCPWNPSLLRRRLESYLKILYYRITGWSLNLYRFSTYRLPEVQDFIVIPCKLTWLGYQISVSFKSLFPLLSLLISCCYAPFSLCLAAFSFLTLHTWSVWHSVALLNAIHYTWCFSGYCSGQPYLYNLIPLQPYILFNSCTLVTLIPFHVLLLNLETIKFLLRIISLEDTMICSENDLNASLLHPLSDHDGIRSHWYGGTLSVTRGRYP